MRLVDLSVPITASSAAAPELLRTEIDYQDHAAGAAQIEQMFGVPSELLRDEEGWPPGGRGSSGPPTRPAWTTPRSSA